MLVVVDVQSRRQVLLSKLVADGKVQVAEFSREAGVSEMTVRRDLEYFAGKGIARRVYGGALLTTPVTKGSEFGLRAVTGIPFKEAIGQAAAVLVRDGEAVIVDAGTTCLAAARALAARPGLTVCPLGFHATAALVDQPGVTVVLPGGEVDPGELSYLGPVARSTLAQFRFDTFLMAVGGVGIHDGVTDFRAADVEIKQAAMRAASRTIVVADADKIGTRTFAHLAPVGDIDVLVTDRRANAQVLQGIRELGVGVHVAGDTPDGQD